MLLSVNLASCQEIRIVEIISLFNISAYVSNASISVELKCLIKKKRERIRAIFAPYKRIREAFFPE